MPASERSLRITDAYRARLAALGKATEQLVARQWRQVTLQDLERSHAAWLRAAVASTEQSQRAGVRLTAAYLAAFIASELGKQPAPVPVDERAVVGVASTGQPLAEPLGNAIINVRAALKDGQPEQEAFSGAIVKATAIAGLAALAAPRGVLAEQIRERPEVAGWRRVTSGGCGACLAAAARPYDPDEPLHVHPHCQCSQEPVVDGAPDHVKRASGPEVFAAMSREQQDKALGPEVAQMVREGRVAWRDLLGHSPMVVGPDLLTQAAVVNSD